MYQQYKVIDNILLVDINIFYLIGVEQKN